MNVYMPKKSLKYISNGIVMAMAVLLLSSCLKSKNDYEPVYSTLMIVNADANTPQAYFFYDRQFLETPINYGSNTPYYENLVGGAFLGFIKTTSDKDYYVRGGVPSVSGTYSVFLAGAGDSSFVVEDKLITPAADKIAIRFVNASKSAEAVDVTLTSGASGSTPVKLSAVKFHGTQGATAPEFKEYPAAATTIDVYAAGSTTQTLATYTFPPTAGKSYTIYLSGHKTPTSESKALKLSRVDHTEAL